MCSTAQGGRLAGTQCNKLEEAARAYFTRASLPGAEVGYMFPAGGINDGVGH